MVALVTKMPVFLCFLLLLIQGCKQRPEVNISAIAHAGGGIQGNTYTNSFEAMNFNYSRGFELFELDFSWTSDQHLVCLHDWQKAPGWLLDHHQKEPLPLDEFHTLQQKFDNLTLCDLPSLNSWLKQNPKAFIVTDIKENNYQGLKLMAKVIENSSNRIIPQFIQPEEYASIKSLGFNLMIWTLYKYKGTDASVVENAEKMDLFALTMPQHRAKRGLAHLITELNIPTYVHTINDLNEALDYQQVWGLTSVYTDFLDKDFKAND